MILIAIFAFVALTSFWVAALVVHAPERMRGFGVDDMQGVQKLHRKAVPRIGGLPIFLSLTSGLLLLAWRSERYIPESAFLIVALIPVFGMGLFEDLTRSAGVYSRLIAAMLSALLGWWLLNAGLVRIDWGLADGFLAAHPVAVLAMTMLATAGSAHAVNIIDGCHGLSSFFVMSAMAALAVIARMVGDDFVMCGALLSLCATGGFFVWNFPKGRIFLGDAGAYMMGFLIAQFSMILIARHPQISAWCVMLIMAYPAWEMLFSIYRRSRIGMRHIMTPDARHLHQLVYRRVIKIQRKPSGREDRDLRSALTSVAMAPMTLLCMVPAVLFYTNTRYLFWLCWLFAFTYVVLYLRIVRFRLLKTVQDVHSEPAASLPETHDGAAKAR